MPDGSLHKKTELFLLVLILAVGSWLRFFHLGQISFSNDELSALTRARFDTFHELVEKGIMVDGHPALVQTMIWFTIHAFNDEVFTVRLPFAVAGVASILLVFLLARRWFGSLTGLLSAAALATLEFPLLYSQTARPYSIGLFFSLMLAYFWTRLLFDEQRKRWIPVAYVIASTGCIYTHYFSFMLAGIVGLSGLFFVKKERLAGYLTINVIPLLLFLPSIPIFRQQFGYEGIGGWLPPPDSNFLMRYIFTTVFNANWIVWILFLGLASYSIRYNWKRIAWKKFHSLSLIWFTVPFLVGYFYSVWKAPVLQFSTLIFSFPFLLLFLFSFLNAKFINEKISAALVLLVLLAGSYSTVVGKHYYKVNHFGVFKELAEKTKSWDEKHPDPRIPKLFTLSNPEYINYYFRKLDHDPQITIYTDNERSRYGSLLQVLDSTTSPYFIYAWTNAVHDYETPALILEKFPQIVERDTFFNSEITLFGKDTAPWPERVISFTDMETNHWNYETHYQNADVAHSGTYSQKMDAKIEFGISYIRNISEAGIQNDEVLKAEGWFYPTDSIRSASLVIAFLRGQEMVSYTEMPLNYFYRTDSTWTRTVVTSEIPAGDCELRVYFWNPGKQVYYIDDLKISASKRHALYRP